MINKLAILLITYNTHELTEKLVKQLNYFDNDLFDLTVIDNTKNNKGFDQTVSEWIKDSPEYLGYWLLNNDCSLNVADNYIEKFIDYIEADDTLGIISTKVEDEQKYFMPQKADLAGTQLVKYIDFQNAVLTHNFVKQYDFTTPYFFGGLDFDACTFAQENNFRLIIDYSLTVKHYYHKSFEAKEPLEDLKNHIKRFNLNLDYSLTFENLNAELITCGMMQRYPSLKNLNDCTDLKQHLMNTVATSYSNFEYDSGQTLMSGSQFASAKNHFKRAIVGGREDAIPLFSSCVFNTDDYIKGAKFLSKYVDRTAYGTERSNYEYMIAQANHHFVNKKEKYTIGFYVRPDAGHPWDPKHTDEGVGGSEIAVINLSKELAKLGHKVVVFNRCAVPETYDGVEWKHLNDFDEYEKLHPFDYMMVSRLPEFRFINSKTKVIYWAHDLNYYERITPTNWQYFDKFLILSRYHYRFFSEAYPWITTDFYDILPNGLDLSRFEQEVERNPKKLIYSSNPDRGLTILLDMFEELHKWDSELELHVFGYYPDNVRKQPTYWRDMPGLIYRGYHNQQELAREYMSSKLWLYPCIWLETFCITAIEAQAAGTPCIVSEWGPLRERIGNAGIVIDGLKKDDDHKHRFVEAVKELLRDKEKWGVFSSNGLNQAKNFTWENSAHSLIKIFNKNKY
jgi:glycosyltransferase involved in cell wall biosynthesis